MIIVMNRTILIPILLTTFLLVGCETELDRCVNANMTEFNLQIFLDKESVNQDELRLLFESNKKEFGVNWILEKGKGMDSVEKLGKEFVNTLNSAEVSFFECGKNSYEKWYKELEKQYPDTWTQKVTAGDYQYQRDNEYCQTLANEEELKRVKSVCHSQGIY